MATGEEPGYWLLELWNSLAGKHRHWCESWDGLPVDETCGEEWELCECHPEAPRQKAERGPIEANFLPPTTTPRNEDVTTHRFTKQSSPPVPGYVSLHHEDPLGRGLSHREVSVKGYKRVAVPWTPEWWSASNGRLAKNKRTIVFPKMDGSCSDPIRWVALGFTAEGDGAVIHSREMFPQLYIGKGCSVVFEPGALSIIDDHPPGVTADELTNLLAEFRERFGRERSESDSQGALRQAFEKLADVLEENGYGEIEAETRKELETSAGDDE